MKRTPFLLQTVWLFGFFCLLLLPNIAYGYFDPGSGSYLIQILLASLLGGLYAIKLFWQKIKNFFTDLFFKKKDGTQTDS